ncbi:MAG: AMP-binding protein [Synechococcaceae cyanobacterium RL_1_2]|nr:AMP-binding protein [Synechococcaceae cyanobacterium RL_1_2]
MDKKSTIYQLLEAQNLDNTDKSCLVDLEDRSLSYGDLFNQINYIIRQLQGLGLTKEDKIAIALPNGVNMAVAFLGVASTGICCPLNPHYRGPEFEFYLSDLNAKALITQDGIAPVAIAIAENYRSKLSNLTPAPTNQEFSP